MYSIFENHDAYSELLLLCGKTTTQKSGRQTLGPNEGIFMRV